MTFYVFFIPSLVALSIDINSSYRYSKGPRTEKHNKNGTRQRREEEIQRKRDEERERKEGEEPKEHRAMHSCTLSNGDNSSMKTFII